MIMNAIKQYEDSSDGSNNGDNEGGTNKEDSRNDFFNLEESESDETSVISEINYRTFSDSQGKTIEVPDTDFWRTVTPDFVQYNTVDDAPNQNDRRPFSLSPSSSPIGIKWTRYKDIKQEDNFQTKNLQKRHQNKDWGRYQPQYKHVKKPHNSSDIEKTPSKPSCNMPAVERKLFFIHSKIKNHLNGRNISSRISNCLEKNVTGHEGPVNRVKWNIPSFSHLLLSVSMDTSVKIWNFWTELNFCVKNLNCHTKAVKDAEWSICGKKIISCSFDKAVAVTDVETGGNVARYEHKSFVNCCKFHPKDTNLILSGCHGAMLLWDDRSPKQPCIEYRYKDQLGQIQDLIFTHHGEEIICCCDQISKDSADRNIMAWDSRAGVVLSNQIYQERYSCTRLKLHPSEGHFLAQSQGGYVALFSVNRPYKMNRAKRYEGHKVLGYGVGFDILGDGSAVLSGSSDGKIYCYNYQTGRCFRQLDTGLDVCLDVAVHPVLPSTLACCGWNGNIQLWH